MSRYHRWTTSLAASVLCGIVSFTTMAARADTLANHASASTTGAPVNIHVDGVYHSVTNGIADYDGFDRFRDASGHPLPGWQQELSSPG
jgi:hypothetical protein